MKTVEFSIQDDLPGLKPITDDMLPNEREDALSHNASIERIKLLRTLPAKDQINAAINWNGDFE